MALAAPKKIQERAGLDGSAPVAANAQIYQGGLVMLDTGVAKAAATGVDAGHAANYVVLGVSEKTVTGGAADGAVSVPFRKGVFKFKNSGGADAILLKHTSSACYAVDDETVALTSNTNVRAKAGTIVDVDADGVWVRVGA